MDLVAIDATTEEQIALHQREDEEEVMKEIARYACEAGIALIDNEFCGIIAA